MLEHAIDIIFSTGGVFGVISIVLGIYIIKTQKAHTVEIKDLHEFHLQERQEIRTELTGLTERGLKIQEKANETQEKHISILTALKILLETNMHK